MKGESYRYLVYMCTRNLALDTAAPLKHRQSHYHSRLRLDTVNAGLELLQPTGWSHLELRGAYSINALGARLLTLTILFHRLRAREKAFKDR